MNSSRNVLSIQNIHCETLGTLEKMLISDNYSIHNIEAWREDIPLNIRDYSAAIILGGPMSVNDKLETIQRQEELVSKCIDAKMPVLGICLGSQVIAQAIGGSVLKGPSKEIGWEKVTFTPASKKGVFQGLDDSLQPFHWHGDTYLLPSGAQVLATSEKYIQSFQYKSALGIQFHFEVDMEMINQWSKEYSNELILENIKPDSLVRPNLVSHLSDACKIFYRNYLKLIQAYEKEKYK